MAIFGLSGPTTDTAILGATAWRQRASIYGAMPTNGWIYSLSARMGRRNTDSGTVVARLGVGSAISGSPGQLLGYTSQINVANSSSYSGDTALYTAAIADASNPGSPTDTAVAVGAGEPLYLTVAIGVGPHLLIQMVQAANSPFSNKNLYSRDAGPIPPNPMAHETSSYEGNLTISANYDANVAPNKPTALSPTGNIAGNGVGQLFTSNFSDSNQNRGDRLARYHLQIIRADNNDLVYEITRDASPTTEQTQSQFTYNGAALPSGTQLKWRIRHADWFGAWGAFSDYATFQVNAGAVISNVGPQAPEHPYLPKVISTMPNDIKFTYNHLSGINGNQTWLQVVNEQGQVVRFAESLAIAMVPGGTYERDWPANWPALTRGVGYRFRVSVGDVAGGYSNEVDGPLFRVNTIPTQPTNLSPSGNTPFTSAPKVSFDATDADNSPEFMNCFVYIRKSDDSWTANGEATWNEAIGKWEWQVPTLPSFGTYLYKVQSNDNVEISPMSAEASFVYTEGPSFTWQLPADGRTFTSDQPFFSWSAPTQTKFQFRVYEQGTNRAIYDSQQIISSAQSYVVPSGYLLNGQALYAWLTIWDANNLSANSPARLFYIDFPDIPANPGFNVSPEYLVGDRDATAVLLTWQKHPDDDPNKFAEYIITRTVDATMQEPRPGIDELPVIVDRIQDFNVQRAYDYLPASGNVYTYQLHRIVMQGSQFLPSLPTTANFSLSFRDCVISEAVNGANRVALRLLTDAQISPQDDVAFQMGWGDTAPTAYVGPADYDVLNMKFALVHTDMASAQLAYNRLERLRKQKTVICFRDNRGVKLFGYLQGSYDYAELGNYEVNIRITQTRFREGYE